MQSRRIVELLKEDMVEFFIGKHRHSSRSTHTNPEEWLLAAVRQMRHNSPPRLSRRAFQQVPNLPIACRLLLLPQTTINSCISQHQLVAGGG